MKTFIKLILPSYIHIVIGCCFLACPLTGAEAALEGVVSKVPDQKMAVGPYELRGYGKISADGARWRDGASVVRFNAEDDGKAQLLASKYIADLTAYANCRQVDAGDFGGMFFEITDAGLWFISVNGNKVYVMSGPDSGVLTPYLRSFKAEQWKAPAKEAYPKYLDCFDNLALGHWWMPNVKSKEVVDFAREYVSLVNAHPHSSGLRASYAPGVYDHTVSDNIVAQAREINKPYRLMIWGGLPSWWARSMGDARLQGESAPDAAQPSRDLGGADSGNTQITSAASQAVELDALKKMMDRYKNDDDLIAWMEPHGEFYLTEPRHVPPGADKKFIEYLQEVKGYDLKQANKAFGVDAKEWREVAFPEHAYFFGRRGEFLDLDKKPWRWMPGIRLENGVELGVTKPEFDDASWALDLRTSRRLLNQFRASGDTAPLWYRFDEIVPDSLVQGEGRIYLHIMPFTEKGGRELNVWVNGHSIEAYPSTHNSSLNKHTQFDVTDQIKSGKNQFSIYSHGGRISYRVFLSKTAGGEFPFSDAKLNQLWIDWNDYMIWEKLKTLETYLAFMRAVDPVRPIKVMTPHMFQSAALDLFEKYGAYPQLTGEGAFYRPMHYKGYTRLRGLPSSSEGGSAAPNANRMQYTFATIFWQNQDAHDYVFDIERDFWSKPDVVQWWKNNTPLLHTLGKIDFVPIPQVGVLRDVEQGERFLNNDIWSWDVSRGPLPRAGISPVLVDGPDLDKGRGDGIPVIFDCSTSVMTPERVAAIKRYVKNGGTFVAQFNTGRHTPVEADSWPLAKAFGLKIEDYSINSGSMHSWPTAKISFTNEQDLVPTLRGKTLAGSGVSIDHMGNERTGGIRIDGDKLPVKAVAKWDDGSMAVADMAYGKGRLVWLGTPFHVRFRDVEGKFLNEDARQELFVELLRGLGVKLNAESSDSRVWVEKRASKNGLYDVYIASAFGVPGRDWKLTDEIVSDLKLGDAHGGTVIDFAGPSRDAIAVTRGGSDTLLLKAQVFNPYQIRQYAVVRKDVGLVGPMHWLDIQSKYWRALDLSKTVSVADVEKQMRAQAHSVGQDGLDLMDDWKVRRSAAVGILANDGWTETTFGATDWADGRLGTWLANGWFDTTLAQYRKRVVIPVDWLSSGRRIFLGFKSGFHGMGILGSGRLWINGAPASAVLKNPMVIDITESSAKGALDLAMEVTGEPRSGGPGGMLYLWAVPRPKEVLDLAGYWSNATAWHAQKGETLLPGKTVGMFGLRRTFELPAHWVGKPVRLVVEQGSGLSVAGAIINQTGYFKDSVDVIAGYGVRVDQWLKSGHNEIDLYGNHSSFQAYHKSIPAMGGEIKAVRLEMYE